MEKISWSNIAILSFVWFSILGLCLPITWVIFSTQDRVAETLDTHSKITNFKWLIEDILDKSWIGIKYWKYKVIRTWNRDLWTILIYKNFDWNIYIVPRYKWPNDKINPETLLWVITHHHDFFKLQINWNLIFREWNYESDWSRLWMDELKSFFFDYCKKESC